MSLRAKIQEDVKVAMKARDQLRVNTVRGVFSEIRKLEIDTKCELDDEQILAVLQKEVKKRKDALQYAVELKREELIEQNNKELELLHGYLGAPLESEELSKVITEIVAGGADSLGKIMGELNKSYKGRFDGKLASELAKQALG